MWMIGYISLEDEKEMASQDIRWKEFDPQESQHLVHQLSIDHPCVCHSIEHKMVAIEIREEDPLTAYKKYTGFLTGNDLVLLDARKKVALSIFKSLPVEGLLCHQENEGDVWHWSVSTEDSSRLLGNLCIHWEKNSSVISHYSWHGETKLKKDKAEKEAQESRKILEDLRREKADYLFETAEFDTPEGCDIIDVEGWEVSRNEWKRIFYVENPIVKEPSIKCWYSVTFQKNSSEVFDTHDSF